MILGFKTQVDGKPTHFVQKILACKVDAYKKDFVPKIHTIRQGKRWKAGISIQMATGVRTKKYFQFNAAGIGLDICKNVQSIEIFRVDDLPRSLYDDCVYIVDFYCEPLNETFQLAFRVQVDGRFLKIDEIRSLALNDGFLNPEELFDWLGNKDFQGQLIHWTDKLY